MVDSILGETLGGILGPEKKRKRAEEKEGGVKKCKHGGGASRLKVHDPSVHLYNGPDSIQ